MKKLSFYPSAFEYTTEPPIKLAQKLTKILPKKSGISKFMFGLTGSDANETAFRLARMYHTIRGESKRTKIISRKYSYQIPSQLLLFSQVNYQKYVSSF